MEELRINLIKFKELNNNSIGMYVGIMDYHRASYMEGFLEWCKHRKIPTRFVLDEYDVYQLFYESRRIVIRDEWLDMIIARDLIDILEVNSASNVSGVISHINKWEKVNKISPFINCLTWDDLIDNISTLDESHFIDLRNGIITKKIERKLEDLWGYKNNIAINIHHEIDGHKKIAKSLEDLSNDIRTINYKSKDSLKDLDDTGYALIGGNKFSRSISIPHLHAMLYYRQNLPNIEQLIQAPGRLLGKGSRDPKLITTPKIRDALLEAIDFNRKIQNSNILSEPRESRIQWMSEEVKSYKTVHIINSYKSNGFLEKTGPIPKKVLNNKNNKIVSESYFSFKGPIDLWNNWDKLSGYKTGPKLKLLAEQAINKKINDYKSIFRSYGEDSKFRINSDRQSKFRLGTVPNKPSLFYVIEKLNNYSEDCIFIGEDGSMYEYINKIIWERD